MTTSASLIASSQSQIARIFASTTIKFTTPGVTVYNSDLSVTMAPSSCTVNCSHPRGYSADDSSGDRVLASGTTYVLIDRSDALLTIEPQPGMVAEVSGEQYRVAKVDYLPGSVRVYLSGGAAEGVGGS